MNNAIRSGPSEVESEIEVSVIRLIIPCVPVAQPRQRHAVIAGHVRNYTPTDSPVVTFKATCRLYLKQEYHGPPLTGPLTVNTVFVMPRPERLNKKKFAPWGRAPHSSRPDIDNLVKSLFDAFKGLAWIDDAQVTRLDARKCHAEKNEQPHVEIEIRETT
jgi:Holliday junction resolvase RusA-like endonuclease